MNDLRIIARLDIKSHNLIKGINLEGLRVIGNPVEYAKKYYESGIDELLYMDTVATLYGRNNLHSLINKTAKEIFVPMTVGGGIRSVEDAINVLRIGADKVAINTAAVKDPSIIPSLAEKVGSQAIVISIEAKQQQGFWEVYTDNGREKTGLDVVKWSQEVVKLGAGEILLTSVDNEGTRKGFDLDLLKIMSNCINVPIIASGGLGCPDHAVKAVRETNINAIAVADYIHYQRGTILELKELAKKRNKNKNYLMLKKLLQLLIMILAIYIVLSMQFINVDSKQK